MKHYDEHILSLLALDSEKISAERDEINKHLSECFSCNELYNSIKTFYEEVSLHEVLPNVNNQDTISSKSLVVEPYIRSNTKVYSPIPVTIIGKTVYVFRTHPIRSGISLIAACIFMFGLINIPKLFKDTSPSFLQTNEHLQRIEVYNKSNQELYDIHYNDPTDKRNEEIDLNIKNSCLVDLNKDGIKEILSVLPNLGPTVNEENYLKVFNSKGCLFFKKELGEDVIYNQTEYNKNFTTRGLLVDDFNNDGNIDLLVGAKHRNSPYVLTRFDSFGNKLGEYWHYGHFWGFNEIDFNNDGKKEILLCGIDDNIEKACIALIDPIKLVSSVESNYSSTFYLPKFSGEIKYITFPNTIISQYLNYKPRIKNLVRMNNSEITVFYSAGEYPISNYNASVGFDIVLDKNFNIKDIKYSDITLKVINEIESRYKIKDLSKKITKEFLNQ